MFNVLYFTQVHLMRFQPLKRALWLFKCTN